MHLSKCEDNFTLQDRNENPCACVCAGNSSKTQSNAKVMILLPGPFHNDSILPKICDKYLNARTVNVWSSTNESVGLQPKINKFISTEYVVGALRVSTSLDLHCMLRQYQNKCETLVVSYSILIHLKSRLGVCGRRISLNGKYHLFQEKKRATSGK